MSIELYRTDRFLSSMDDAENAKIIMIGAPMDWTVTFRPGSRFGPRRIREISEVLEEYSLSLDANLSDVPFYDAGDLVLPFGDLKGSFDIIRKAALRIYEEGKIPIFLGGEHLITFPVIQVAASFFPGLSILHFDSHMDLRDDYLGAKYSHSTVMRRSLEETEAGQLFQFGIRSGIEEEVKYDRFRVKTHSVNFLTYLEVLLQELSDSPVYVTLDIDVVDPAYAPGTGTPEPGGISSQEILEVLYLLAKSKVNIVGFDLVEVAPAYDISDITSILAAKILRETLLILGMR